MFVYESFCNKEGAELRHTDLQTSRVKGPQSCAPQQKLLTQIYQVKISQREVKKCYYFNFGYCQYTMKENGFTKFHPIDECKIQGCKQKLFSGRQPKQCKFNDEC